MERLRIALVPVGEVDPAILSLLRDDLAGIFDAEIDPWPPLPLGRKHLVKERDQYVADGLLDEISSLVSGPGTVLLGITAVDLFSPGMNFVFGIANRGKALVSVFRLRPEFYGVRHRPSGPGGRKGDPAVFRKRVLTEAVHELGHALGLQHCEYPGCVMYFSNWIGDTDRKGPGFCFRCARALERLMVTGGP
ncbi:MAG: archaemetzincin family Zn-dependent metalloprotease [Methanomicrobiales archaeon]|nr:archaemetzincin family Zn-dependent metalloprotease [Methanomicrobiales archaeon]